MPGLSIGISLGRQRGVPFDPSLYTWVDNRYTGETEAGTFDQPFKTLAGVEAATGATAPSTTGKTTIYVKPGTYTEDHVFSKAYTYKAYGAVTLKSSGTSQVVGGKASTANNWTLDGFILDGQTTATYGAQVGTSNTSGTVTIRNCQFINPKTTGYGVSVGNSDCPKIVIEDCSFSGACYSSVMDRSTSAGAGYNRDITVTRCTFSSLCTLPTICMGSQSSGTANGTVVISVTDCVFAKNVTRDDIQIGKAGTYEITGNTFTFVGNAANLMGVVKLLTHADITSAMTGSIVCSNNTVTMGSYTISNTSIFRFTSAAIFAVTVCGNTITSTGNVSGTSQVIYIQNQDAFVCENNVIEMPAATSLNSTITYKQPTVTPSAPAKINYNTIKVPNATGYVILAGTDAPDTNLDLGDGIEIIGNLIYGARYYGTATPIVHSLFVGYFKDVTVKHNVLIGAGAGIVWEHNNEATAAATAGIYGNVLIDCYIPIVAGGINNAKFYNNTIINRVNTSSILVTFKWNDTMPGVEWDEENPTPNTGLEFKNNIVYNKSTSVYACVKLGAHCDFAVNGCDYNLLYSDSPNTIGNVADAGKTIAQWIAMGYDGNSVWNDGACELPKLTDIISAMELVNVTPTAGSNVIAAGANLGAGYDDAIIANAVPPITTAKTDEQPSEGAWTIGAVLPE